MIPKTDFHIHTSFCDGKQTPAELAAVAYDRGFSAIGFSGHCFTPFDTGYCMSEDGTDRYRSAVAEQKDKFSGKMAVFCGVEQDFFAPLPTKTFDYCIGSVHYLPADSGFFPVDESPESLAAACERYFGGDTDALCEAYFALVGRVVPRTGADIIGHFDLIMKFADALNWRETARYRAAATAAIEALLPFHKPFEINVGAMTRGWRGVPYPSESLLQVIRRGGGQIILSGDCHDADRLGDCLPEAAALARSCGFSEAVRWTDTGFVPYSLG